MNEKHKFMSKAIRLSIEKVEEGMGGPFGAVIVKDNQIIATGYNQVTSVNDPTAHAEIIAIREACLKLNTHNLTGCEIYTSCEPCPMCMGAIYWARIGKIYYGNTNKDAEEAGFIDKFILEDLNHPPDQRKIPMEQLMREEAIKSFEKWKSMENKKDY